MISRKTPLPRKNTRSFKSIANVLTALVALCALASAILYTQTRAAGTTYFSQGSLPPEVLASWNTQRNGSGTPPLDFTSGDTFVIQNTHNMGTAVVWTVSGAGATVEVESGGTLTANNVVAVPNFQVDNGGTYVHNAASGASNGTASDVPGSTSRTFGASSTVEFQKWANGGTGPVALPGVSWGNLKINVATLAGSWSQGGSLTSVQGNLVIQSTGGTTREFRLGASTSPTLTVGGDLVISGGVLNLSSGTGTPTVNLGGNYNQSGGTLTSTGSGVATFAFTGGSSLTAFTFSGGTLTDTNINWSIAGGKTVQFNNAFALAVSRTFTINQGGMLLAAATVNNGGALTVNGEFRLTDGGFATGNGFTYGATGTLGFVSSAPYGVGDDAYWPTTNGPANVTVLGGGVTMNVARTVGGLFQYSGGVFNMGNLTLDGTSQVNNGGFASGSPTYGPSSLLKYNIGNPSPAYGRNGEWLPNVTSGAGYPANVQLSNNTTLDLPNSSTGSPFQLSGSLTIDSGSTLSMGAMTQPLNVLGSVNNNGTLNLSSASGGDIHAQGDWADAGTLNPNNRAVFFEGGNTQSAQSTVNPFVLPFVVVNKTGGTVSLGTSLTVNGTLTLTNGTITTGANALNVGNAGTVAHANGYVIGTEQKAFAGGGSFTFDVGTANGYSPVDANSTTGTGTLSVRPTQTRQPNVSPGTNALSRYWTLAGSGVTTNLTFHYLAGDVVGNESSYQVIKYDGSFSTPPNQSVNAAAHTATVNGVSSFSDWTLAEAAPDYTVTTTGGAIVVTDVSGNGDTLIVSEPVAGQIKFAAAGRFFSVDGGASTSGDSGSVSLSGINSITINQGDGDDTLSVQQFTSQLPSLTVNGGAGDDNVNFNGSVTFKANASLDANLQDDTATPGADSVVVASGVQLITSGAGTIDVRVSKSVTVGGLLQTQNGILTVEANQQATATAGAFVGVGVSGGTIQTTGTGNVSVKGTGGAGDFTENFGVEVAAGGQVLATGGGTITVNGTGGAGAGGATAGQSNIGVYVTDAGSLINSAGGAVQVTGQGGATNNSDSVGVKVDGNGKIQTSGAGTLTVNGTGGTVNGGDPTFVDSGGVFIVNKDDGSGNLIGGTVASTGTGASAGNIVINGLSGSAGAGAGQGIRVDAPSTVTTVDGSITFDGTGGPCGNACLGTSIRGAVTATGAGAINITGTGATTNGAFPVHGVNVRSGGNVSAKDGDITIKGTGGSGSTTNDNAGFNLASSGTGTLQTTGNGNVVVNADIIAIRPAPSTAATINAGAHAVTFRQKTSGTAINLGSTVDTTASTVELSNGELARVTAGTINFGDSNSGAITVSANITRASATNLVLTSGANIDIAAGTLTSAGGNVSLNPGTDTFPSDSGVDVNAGAGTLTLAAAKDLKVVINGTTADTQYTQLNVAGLVNLDGANLSLGGSLTPSPGQQFVVVNNDGADAITGTFDGLPEGATITNFLGSGFDAQITYAGGDGNDAVLTVVAPPSFSIDDVTQAEGNSGTTAFIFTVTKTGAGAASVNYATADGTATTADNDYQSASGALDFASGDVTKTVTVLVNGDTRPELDETFSVNLSGASGATISRAAGTGTIRNDDESASAGQLIISEFRLRGPGKSAAPPPTPATAKAKRKALSSSSSTSPPSASSSSGGAGAQTSAPNAKTTSAADTSAQANDEFVELYNATDSPLLVTTTDGSKGWALAASDGVVRFIVPDGTVIPARGHFLGTNTLGYSLGSYPAGDDGVNPMTAAGDAVLLADGTPASGYTLDIPDNAGIAVFRTSNAANFSTATRLDAAGSTSESNALYKEGAGYPALSPSDIAQNLEGSFYRSLCSFVGGAGCTTPGVPKDTDDNASDFLFVDTKGALTAAGQRLGAPGPENLSSPIQRNSSLGFNPLDRSVNNSLAPNRVRDPNDTSDPNTKTFGTLSIRRRVTNTTGSPVTRLRFRIVEVTTFPPPGGGVADLRALTSGNVPGGVANMGDADTCAPSSAPCAVTVEGTTLEEPPAQSSTTGGTDNGGGFNSSLSVGSVTLSQPLAPGQSVNVQFLLGVRQTGTFRFLLNIEALP